MFAVVDQNNNTTVFDAKDLVDFVFDHMPGKAKARAIKELRFKLERSSLCKGLRASTSAVFDQPVFRLRLSQQLLQQQPSDRLPVLVLMSASTNMLAMMAVDKTSEPARKPEKTADEDAGDFDWQTYKPDLENFRGKPAELVAFFLLSCVVSIWTKAEKTGAWEKANAAWQDNFMHLAAFFAEHDETKAGFDALLSLIRTRHPKAAALFAENDEGAEEHAQEPSEAQTPDIPAADDQEAAAAARQVREETPAAAESGDDDAFADEAPAPLAFEIENDIPINDKPAVGATRSLGYVRHSGRFTNLFLVANWDEQIGRFLKTELKDRFPRFGAVSLDSTSPLKVSDGAFFVLDHSKEDFHLRKDEFGEARSDFLYGIWYEEVCASHRLLRLDQAGGYLVVYPENDPAFIDYLGNIFVRYQKDAYPGEAQDRKLLHITSGQVLLAVGNRFYGPLNLLEDASHRPYVNLQLRSGTRVVKGFMADDAHPSVMLTVNQSGFQEDLHAQAPVDIVFVRSLKRMAFDMFTDEALLSKLSQSIAENRNERERFEEWATTQLEAAELFSDDKRIRAARRSRIRRLMHEIQSNDRFFTTITDLLSRAVDRRAKDQSFFEAIVKQLADNPALMQRLESHRVIAAQINHLRETVSQLEIKRNALKADIARKTEIERREAEKSYQSLLDRKDALEREVESRTRALGLANEVGELLQKKNELEEKVDGLAQKREKFYNEIESVDAHLQNAVQNAHKYAFDGAIASKLLQAASEWETDSQKANFSQRAQVISRLTVSAESGPALRNRLVEDVQRYRSYDVNTILNLFISVTQNFLTVFSGDPGSGKTSICEIIAHVLGLRSLYKNAAVLESGLWRNPLASNRFLTVPVERGWTSKRDFIGYYNPLSKTFESVDSRRIEAFAELDAESRLAGADLPYLMLLDEANLSPMEYYWGDFMRLCDAQGRTEYVSFGGGATYAVTDALRFLATINNDFTTESLSPRLIDRAAVIRLPELETASGIMPAADDLKPLVSWKAMKELFGAHSQTGRFEETEDLLDDIYAAFRSSLGICVSARTRLAIEGYVRAASRVFEANGRPAHISAVDYAVVQRIMPRIDGNGAQYRKKLEALQSLFDGNGLDLSRRTLAEILERGDNSMGWYRFF